MHFFLQGSTEFCTQYVWKCFSGPPPERLTGLVSLVERVRGDFLLNSSALYCLGEVGVARQENQLLISGPVIATDLQFILDLRFYEKVL